MCGICGELRFDQQAPNVLAISAMKAALARRGPDDEGLYVAGPIGMGHRRLSIIDLSTESHQPMIDVMNNSVLVFNGTIYNYRALRQQLEKLGEQFVSSGDTEVILKSYAVWGASCVEHFEGMFAFALWDPCRQQLLLARDRLGIKPLYWSRNNNRLRFASSLPALLAADQASDAADQIDRSINYTALHFQFTLHGVVPAPHTILQGVQKCPPAHILVWQINGRCDQHRYWFPSACRTKPPLADAAALSLTEHELNRAVASQLAAADVPVGVLLSGGLDSSLLVALMHHQRQESGQTEPLHTFSLGFEDQPEEKGDEFLYSDMVAQRFATEHHQYRINNQTVLARLPEAVAAMSEPMFSQDNIAFYLLAEKVSAEVKVVLSGQGADEIYGGYYWYPQMAQAAQQLDPLQSFAQSYYDRDQSEWLDMLNPNAQTGQAAQQAAAMLATNPTSEWVNAQLSQPNAETFLDAVLRMDVTSLIVDDPVKRVDNMTMAWGLEARVPFLEHYVVEAALQLSPEFKLREQGKYPLKAIARNYLPEALISRPKGYFPTPAIKFLRGGILDYIRGILESPASRNRSLFNRAYIDRLLAAPLSHFTRLQGNKLWHMAVFEAWLQQHVD